MDLSAIQIPGYAGTIFASCWTGQAWIVAGQPDGRAVTPVFRSTDLINWTEIALPAGWGTALAFAIADDGLGNVVLVSSVAAYSSDHGQTWAMGDNSAYSGQTLYDVVFALGSYIAVGTTGTIVTSTTGGASWVKQTTGVTSFLTSIAWDGGDNIVVGGGTRLMKNAPGSLSSWTTVTSSYNCYGMTYHPETNRFYGYSSTSLAHYHTPGATTIEEITTFSTTSMNWNNLNTLLKFAAAGSSLLFAPSNTQQLAQIDTATHSVTPKLDSQGSAIVGVTYQPTYVGGVLLMPGANGILYTSATQQVQGTITDGAGTPAQRTVRLYDRNTGKYLAETQSDPTTGAYAFTIGMGHPEVQRIAVHDDTAEGVIRNDLIDRVIPG
ncbi:MAG: hypothetical protein ACNA7T_05135 [Haliea sp.]